MDHISKMDHLARITRRREFEDGLADFLNGVVIFIVCLMSWIFFSPTGLRMIAVALVQFGELAIIALLALVFLLILFIIGARKVIDRIRRAIIWRDHGFVKSLKWQVSWQTNLLAVGVAVTMMILSYWMMTIGAIKQDAVLRTLVSSSGVATGIVYYGMGRELIIHRYKWVGGVGGALSTIIMVIPAAFHASWLMLGILWMSVLSVSGLWALRKSLLTGEGILNE